MRVLSGPRSAVVAALCLLPALLGLAAPAAAATAWSKPHHLPGHQAQGSLAALSCVSGSLCRSVDWGGSTRTFDGTAWSDVQQVTHWYGGLQAVSCSGRESCVAVGGRRTVIRRAGGWSAVHVAPRPGLEWVSCVSATLCLAATDRAYVLRWDGHHWSHGTRVSRARDGIRQVSCTSRTFCMAMDSVDHAFRFDGHGWTREHAFAGQTRLERFGLLSCYGTRRCLAVAFGHKQQDAVAVRYGAHGWGVARRTHLGTEPAALSCVASTFCVLLDSSGRARRLGAAGWQHLASVSITHDPLYRLSCGARGSCVATGQAGNSWQLASGAWSPVAVPQVPTRDATPSDDCVSAGHCVVLDGHGSVWTLDAGTWTRAHGLGLTCRTRSPCATSSPRPPSPASPRTSAERCSARAT